MYGSHSRDYRRQARGLDSRSEACNARSSGDWVTLPNKETFQIPELEVKRDNSRTGLPIDSGEETKPGLLSDDEFSHISFPTIGFCDNVSKQEFFTKHPQIVDLCKEDKQRIAQLVKEISRCREEQKEKTVQIKTLTDENAELKSKIFKLEKELNILRVTVKYSDDNVKILNKSFVEKEMNLKKENSQLQNSLTELTEERSMLQLKIEEEHKQIEKLSRAIYNVSMENKMINKKYDHTKEKLKCALETVSKIESEFDQKNSMPKENKSSQTDVHLIKTITPRRGFDRRRDDVRFHRVSSWKYEHSARDSSDEDSLLSELFFIPKQKNLHKSHYTSDDDFY